MLFIIVQIMQNKLSIIYLRNTNFTLHQSSTRLILSVTLLDITTIFLFKEKSSSSNILFLNSFFGNSA